LTSLAASARASDSFVPETVKVIPSAAVHDRPSPGDSELKVAGFPLTVTSLMEPAGQEAALSWVGSCGASVASMSWLPWTAVQPYQCRCRMGRTGTLSKSVGSDSWLTLRSRATPSRRANLVDGHPVDPAGWGFHLSDSAPLGQRAGKGFGGGFFAKGHVTRGQRDGEQTGLHWTRYHSAKSPTAPRSPAFTTTMQRAAPTKC
jgi:hypothetical protein